MLYLRKTRMRLALKLFRGEPAISGFDWNFSPIHTSSPPFSTDVGSVLHCLYGNFNLDMDRSPGFGSTPADSFALFRLGFPSAPGLRPLTFAAGVTRRTVLQKVRGSAYKAVPQALKHMVSGSLSLPPGVLFTVPSQYYALSVTKSI